MWLILVYPVPNKFAATLVAWTAKAKPFQNHEHESAELGSATQGQQYARPQLHYISRAHSQGAFRCTTSSSSSLIPLFRGLHCDRFDSIARSRAWASWTTWRGLISAPTCSLRLRYSTSLPRRRRRLLLLLSSFLCAEAKFACAIQGLKSCVNLKWLSVKENKLESLKGIEGLSKLTVSTKHLFPFSMHT